MVKFTITGEHAPQFFLRERFFPSSHDYRSLALRHCFFLYPSINPAGYSVEEGLLVIIFHCRLKNMKKLIKSSSYQKQPTLRGQSLFFSILSGGPWSSYPHKEMKNRFSKNLENELLFWIIFLKIYIKKKLNLLMSLLRHRDMTEIFLICWRQRLLLPMSFEE